jgi:HlyD family secretion protein
MSASTAVRSAARAAAARRDAAREALRLLREGTRPERIRAARAEVEDARAALAAAKGTAGDLVITAPVNGTILTRYAEPGEILAAGEAALTIGEVSKPWVRIYVGQNVLPLIHVGDSASARLDDFPERRFAGRVVSISDKAEFTPRVALTEEERSDLVFGVKIELRDTSGMLKAGLPVTVQLAGAPRERGPLMVPSDSPASMPISSRP